MTVHILTQLGSSNVVTTCGRILLCNINGGSCMSANVVLKLLNNLG